MTNLDFYFEWLKEQFQSENTDSWAEIITPFLDKNNDHIQIYLQEKKNKIIISDAGQTFSNLEITGFPMTDKRVEILSTIFRGHNIDWSEESTIEITCEKENFPERFHALLQTIMSVDSLAYFSQDNVKSMFLDDVANLLRSNQITYRANEEITGRSGIPINFPFHIPSHNNIGESYLQLINQPKHYPKQWLFEWSDTQDERGNSNSIAVINDINIKPSKLFLKSLREYGVDPVLWTDKESLIEKLIA